MRLNFAPGVAVLVLVALMTMLAAPAGAAPVSQPSQGCFFTTPADATLYSAPIRDVTQAAGTLPRGVRATVLAQSPLFLHIALDVANSWYVERSAGTLSGECGLNIPTISDPLQAFPTVCVFTTGTVAPALYADSGLTVPAGNLLPNASYAAVRQTPTAYYLYIDHAYGAWVSRAAGTASGNCAALPGVDPIGTGTAVALENARLWSQPDVFNGAVLTTLVHGATLDVLSGPVAGRIRFDDAGLMGQWYQVRERASGAVGWLWEGRIAFGTA